MPIESDAVAPNESILRRIVNAPNWYDAKLSVAVTPLAMRPIKRDIDGLSVYRTLFTTARDVAAYGNNEKGYYVAEIAVAQILGLGLTLIPDPRNEGPRGHTLIPELTYGTRYDTEEIQLALARLASERIVWP